MSKRYTRQQIIESIKHWENVLYHKKINVHTTPKFVQLKRKTNDMGLTAIDYVDDDLDFSELNSEAFQNMINSIVSDGVNLNEEQEVWSKDKTLVSKKTNRQTHLSHIDYV